MKGDYFKYFKPQVLIVLIGILIIGILLANIHWGFSISVLSLVTFSIITISEYLWKYRPFIWMFWFDDFSGRYEGIIKFSYKDNRGNLQQGELPHVKLIKQTGSKIIISSFTIKANGLPSSLSISKGIHLEKTEDGQHFRIIYNYLNDGSNDQGFSPHYGTEVIKFIKNEKGEKFLSGYYYTNRKPFQTSGDISNMKWISNDLNHEY